MTQPEIKKLDLTLEWWEKLIRKHAKAYKESLGYAVPSPNLAMERYINLIDRWRKHAFDVYKLHVTQQAYLMELFVEECMA